MMNTGWKRISMKRLLLSFVLLSYSFSFAEELPRENEFPWTQSVPKEIYTDYVKPNVFWVEKKEPWRERLYQLICPQVRECKDAESAVLTIASKIGEISGAYYTVERRTAIMSPMETLREKKVSCSGQSILLAAAFRSVGIPARVVGIETWAHVPGNHTWCEAWVGGAWKMIEFNETNFNTPWVMENVGMLDCTKDPRQRILAASGGDDPKLQIDVSDRYASLAKQWYKENGITDNNQRICIEVRGKSGLRRVVKVALYNEQGELLKEGKSPSESDDFRQFLSWNVPRNVQYKMKIFQTDGGELCSQELEASDSPVQILKLKLTEDV